MTAAASSTFAPRDYDVFVSLDVDQRSMAIKLMRATEWTP